jgi:hypothetical protein
VVLFRRNAGMVPNPYGPLPATACEAPEGARGLGAGALAGAQPGWTTATGGHWAMSAGLSPEARRERLPLPGALQDSGKEAGDVGEDEALASPW